MYSLPVTTQREHLPLLAAAALATPLGPQESLRMLHKSLEDDLMRRQAEAAPIQASIALLALQVQELREGVRD